MRSCQNDHKHEEERHGPHPPHRPDHQERASQTAEFYKQAFGLKELRRSRNGAVFLTDGYIHLAVLNHKDERSPDMGAHGPNFSGIHHFGFAVDDLGEACARLEEAHAERLIAKSPAEAEARAGHANSR
jgi:catechol-2,3-dioxygenase